ncbi:MAG: lysophospholipid acyltransferase family protein [Deltaproteobacteria bacterium]|nr:lysophospholipid acyltransferase family protein [Nannocystaceae bacterium]
MLPAVKRWLGQTWLRLHGWRLEGPVPEPRRFVLLMAPHTSNWDAVFMLALGYVYEIRIEWMVKDSLFFPPMGWLLRALGGIPINRRASHGVVGQMVDAFARRDELILGVPPEGTRTRSTHWKSGFYEIARTAGVPIVMGFLDFGKKVGGMGPVLQPSGDVVADMDRIRAFYADIAGLHPGEFTPPRLKLEDAPRVTSDR